MRPGRGRPRDKGADAAILAAAIELFAEHGVEGASIEQVARRAGVTRATVYRRWTTKEELFADALGRVREGEGPQVADWAKVDADELVRLMTEAAPQVLGRADLAKLVSRLLGASQSRPELVQAYWNGYLAPRREAFDRALEAMKAAGRLRPDADPEIIQDMLAGALIYRFLVHPGPHDEAVRRDYGRRLLQAIGLKLAPD